MEHQEPSKGRKVSDTDGFAEKLLGSGEDSTVSYKDVPPTKPEHRMFYLFHPLPSWSFISFLCALFRASLFIRSNGLGPKWIPRRSRPSPDLPLYEVTQEVLWVDRAEELQRIQQTLVAC